MGKPVRDFGGGNREGREDFISITRCSGVLDMRGDFIGLSIAIIERRTIERYFNQFYCGKVILILKGITKLDLWPLRLVIPASSLNSKKAVSEYLLRNI
jgi:hypothetical protein